MLHDLTYHLRRRGITYRLRYAFDDLFHRTLPARNGTLGGTKRRCGGHLDLAQNRTSVEVSANHMKQATLALPSRASPRLCPFG